VGEVVRLTQSDPPHEATHWTARAMAAACGLPVSTVQEIWKKHGLAPHRWRTFKLSTDPAFVAKLRDVVRLYVDPPAHAIVLSVDEKSQIQALERTQGSLPMKTGRAATWTHDYVRHGTTTLFAALNVLDGTVIGRNMQRHHHQEFIRFLNIVEATVPAGKIVHAILDNYAAQGPAMARASFTLDLPLHPNLVLMAQRCRGLFRQAHQAAPQARRLPVRRRPPGHHPPLHRRAQPGIKTIRLACRPRRHHRSPNKGVPNAVVSPLVSNINSGAADHAFEKLSSPVESRGCRSTLCR
jgi:hypothetical protein